MIVAMVFAQVWGVLQLAALGSLARTVRLRTVCLAVLVGVYACTAVVVPLQALLVHAMSAVTGMSVYDTVSMGTYTVGPAIEEIVKLLPLLLLFRLPAPRRQWTITDHVLIAAAVGSGMGLAEALFSADKPQHANAIAEGWMLATNLSLPVVPSIWTSLTSWLPPAVTGDDVRLGIEASYPWINVHLVWSAMGGFAMGLYRLEKHAAAKAVALAVLVYIIGDHMAWNAELSRLLPFAFGARYRGWMPYLPLVMIAAAWVMDRRRWPRGASWPLLACESASGVRVLGLIQGLPALLSAGPIKLFEFLRLRRAAATAVATARDEATDDIHRVALEPVVLRLRDRLDAPRAATATLIRSMPRRIGSPRSVAKQKIAIALWLLMLLPAFVWFVVAGGPDTAWLRAYFRTPWGAWLIAGTTAAALVWTARRAIAGLRLLRGLETLPDGDLAATIALRTLVGWGTLAFGGYTLTRMFWLSPTSSLVSIMNELSNASQASADEAALMCVGPAATEPPAIEPPHETEPEKHKTAVEWWMGHFFGEPGNPGPLQIHDGDSDGVKLLRALGLVGLLPIWGLGVFGANAVDEVVGGGPFHFVHPPGTPEHVEPPPRPAPPSEPQPPLYTEKHGHWWHNPETGEWASDTLWPWP